MTNHNQGPYVTMVPMTAISSFDPYPSGPMAKLAQRYGVEL